MPFTLDKRLENDTIPVTDLALCKVLLMNDANYPWLILVPRHPDLVELVDLPNTDRKLLTEEIDLASVALRRITRCDKLNVAALGNMVRQLHVHVIARFEDDPAWPGPVWGKVQSRPYQTGDRDNLIARVQAEIGASPNRP